MRLSVEHCTIYEYGSPVSYSRNELRLKPREQDNQSLISFSLAVEPTAVIQQRNDYYDNAVHVCEINQSHQTLSICSRSQIHTQPQEIESDLRFRDYEPDDPGLKEFLLPTELVGLDRNWAADFDLPTPAPNDCVTEYLGELLRAMDQKFNYQVSSTDVGTTLEEFSRHRSGVCQDFAHALLAVCREQSMPARYVSGYVKTGQGSEASHAWVEVYLPDIGWVGLDPTHNQFTDEQYVILAYGRDYNDCAPVTGIRRGGGNDTMTVNVDVQEIESSHQTGNVSHSHAS
jgi:transglutaminase-like putative cysteine protease